MFFTASSSLKIKCCKSRGMQEKVSFMEIWGGWKIPSLGVAVRYHSASLVMPISDPRDTFFEYLGVAGVHCIYIHFRVFLVIARYCLGLPK